MPLMPILLVAVLVLAEQGVRLGGDSAPWWVAAGTAAGGAALLVAMARAAAVVALRAAERRRSVRPLLAADRFMRWARWIVLVNHAVAVLALNWLGVARSIVARGLGLSDGDVIVLDELLALAPAVVGLLGLWWAYEPVHRRLTEALIMRRLDEGQGFVWHASPWRFVFQEFRIHVLLLLAPLLLIMAIGEALDPFIARWSAQGGAWIEAALSAAPMLIVFMFFPLVARFILDTAPLEPGGLRNGLLGVCARHGVRVRSILLWNTDGAHVNAAVMGLAGPLRFVLLTDALVERMPYEQLEGVMAHEIGHVRHHHLLWGILALLACGVLSSIAIEGPVIAISPLVGPMDPSLVQWIVGGMAAAEVALTLTLGGWVFRRLERQADTFAVQHLSGYQSRGSAAKEDASRVISPEAVDTMVAALGSVARLNFVETDRPSWRHGSILWRQRYLRRLIGTSMERPAIDSLVRRIKGLSLVVVGIGLPMWLYLANAAEREGGEAAQQTAIANEESEP